VSAAHGRGRGIVGHGALGLLVSALLLGGGREAVSQGGGSGACAGTEAAVASAAQALDRGQWSEADRLLQPLVASHGECGKVVLALARLRAARGDSAEAERLFSRATSIDSGDAVAHAHFAQYWLSRDQPARADYEAALALSLDPDCAEALAAKGRLLAGKGRVEEARQVLETAVRLDPGNAEAHYRLGILSFRGKRPDVSATHFEKVVALRPVDALAFDYLALSREALGDAEEAERAWRRGLDVNEPPFFDALLDLNYGRFLRNQGRLDESQSHLDRATKLLPGRRGVHYERAKLALARKSYPAARDDAERALRILDPSGLVLDVQVYYLLATVYARLGDTDLARKYADLARTTPIPDQARDRLDRP
jgi:tetratricopeptide (TPR) repeat protein